MNNTISKRKIDQLAAAGRYFEADSAVEGNRETKDAMALTRRKLLEEEQALQWQAFSRAKAQFLADTQLATASAQGRKREALRQKLQDDALAHEEELEAFATREEAVILRRPVPQSASLVELRREERQLSLQRKFAEAAVLRDMAAQRETTEQRLALREKECTLTERIRAREMALQEKERASLANLRFKVRLEHIKAERGLSCLQAALVHMEADMAAAHEKQRQQLQALGYVPDHSKAQLWKASRGSLLERRVLGDPYSLPPMCEMYGDWFDVNPSQYGT